MFRLPIFHAFEIWQVEWANTTVQLLHSGWSGGLPVHLFYVTLQIHFHLYSPQNSKIYYLDLTKQFFSISRSTISISIYSIYIKLHPKIVQTEYIYIANCL